MIRLFRAGCFYIFVGIFLAVFCPSLKAQTSSQVSVDPEMQFRERLNSEVTEDKSEESFHQEIDSYARHMPYTSLKSQEGKLSILDSGSQYSYEFKTFEKLGIQLFLDSQYINIEGSSPVILPAHLTGLSAGVETTLPFFKFDNTYFRVRVMPAYYSDDWDFHSSAFRIPVHSFMIYQPNEKWTFIGGIAVYPDFETPVFPILGFIYKPNDLWTFNLIPERPYISYRLNDKITLFTEGGFSSEEFEVKKDNFEGAVLSYNEIHFAGGLEYQLNKNIKASVSSGYMFDRYFKYRDSLGKVTLKNNIYSELKVEMSL